MRLYNKDDAILGVVLIFSAVIVFQQPLRALLDIAHEVEARYHLDLIPALTVLMGVFAFHEHRKRQRGKHEKAALLAEMGVERARSGELERCIQLSKALADSRDDASLEQALWRYLPTFVPQDAWLLTRRRDSWRLVFQKEQAELVRPLEQLEEIASRTLTAFSSGHEQDETAGETSFPLAAGGNVVGVLGVRGVASMSALERESLTMAGKLIAIAVRNVQLFKEIAEEGVTDSLTGCFNRRHAVDRLSGELRRANRGGRAVSVLMLDLDDFKAVNEGHGHLAGDQVLTKIGARLRSMLRSTDIPCRYGGDEFLIILPETPPTAAEHVAECIRREIAALAQASAGAMSGITVSIGVAGSNGDADPQVVIERADQALFGAKRASQRSREGVQTRRKAV